MKQDNFCKNCGSLLISLGSHSKCSRCGKEDSAKNIRTEEKIPAKPKIGEGSVKNENVFATYEHKCTKCGHDKAEIIDQGVKYSDEESSIYLGVENVVGLNK